MAKKVKTKKFNPNPGTSEFNGGVLALIGWNLLIPFVTLISLGIALPWVECAYHRWIARHTKINGLQVVFDGKGGQLFGKNIAWFLLCVITFGIYTFWLPIRKQQWLMKHTYIEKRTSYASSVNMQNCNQAAQYPQCAQYPQYPQYPAAHCCQMQQQYYYPCASMYSQYPQGGCCQYYR